MKHFFLICFGVMCMLEQINAQSDSLKFLIGLSPFISTNYKDESLKYPVQVQNQPYNPSRYWQEEPLDVKSFVEIQLPIQMFTRLKNNYYFTYGARVDLQFYEANIDHTISGRAGYETEKINTQNIEVGLGLSRIFFLGAKKRLLITPEVSSYCNYYGFNSEATSDFDVTDNYPIHSNSIIRTDLSLGGKFNLWVNYRLTKKIGLGLVFPKIVDIYGYTNSGIYASDEWTKGSEFTLNPAPLPRLFVFWHLR